MAGGTNRMMFLLSVHEREGIKEKHNENRHEGERWGKECEAKLG